MRPFYGPRALCASRALGRAPARALSARAYMRWRARLTVRPRGHFYDSVTPSIACNEKEHMMRINPPGTPQSHSNQPHIHTFIGDTPQAPERSDLELAQDNYGAVRAYQRSLGISPAAREGDEEFDIRKAHPRLQARWLASDAALTY